MSNSYTKIASMLRAKPETLRILEQKMNALTGQDGVLDDIVLQNNVAVDRTLGGLGLSRRDKSAIVREALAKRLGHLDRHLYELLGMPDLTKTDEASAQLREIIFRVFTPPKGAFLKRDRMVGMLEKYPPHNVLRFFGCATVQELVDKEGFAPIVSSLRFTQSEKWMHQFFEVAYRDLRQDDFEERDVELIILPSKWLAVSEKFVEKKYHNVSHLKEFGIIFVIPVGLDAPGGTLRLFTLILHYLHEVPFYADLFGRHLLSVGGDFSQRFRSLLRGDVPYVAMKNHDKLVWRIVQRYLTKDNPDDFRLFEPHVSPEADHWRRAEEDLGRLSRILGRENGELDLGWWADLDFVGELFVDPATGAQELVSFDLIDRLMSLTSQGQEQFLYHQQEAMWNKIFTEYMGRERMEELIREHIISGFIELP